MQYDRHFSSQYFRKDWRYLYRQAIGIPVGTNSAPLLVDLLLYSHESAFLDSLIGSGNLLGHSKFVTCIQRTKVFSTKKSSETMSKTFTHVN